MPEVKALTFPNLPMPFITGSTDPEVTYGAGNIPLNFPWLDTSSAPPILKTHQEGGGWVVVSGGGGGGGDAGQLNVKDFGAVGDGVTDDEPAIQAVLNIASGLLPDGSGRFDGDNSYKQMKTVFFPPGTYALKRPLRVKTKVMALRGPTPSAAGKAQFIGKGYGPMMVVYSDHDVNGEPGSENGPASQNMFPALLTGAGSSFDLTTYNWFVGKPSPSGRGASDDNRYLVLRPETIACEFNALPAFTAECTIKVRPASASVVTNGVIMASQGGLIGFPERGRDCCFQIIMVGAPAKARVSMTVAGVSHVLTGATSLLENNQYHIALTYDGAYIRLFVNGVLDATAVAATGPVTQQAWENVSIGTMFEVYTELAPDSGISNGAPVLIDGVRFSKVARYTADFTPMTAKPAFDTDTMLIINFNNNFDIIIGGIAPVGGTPVAGEAYFVLRQPNAYFQNGGSRFENLNFYGWPTFFGGSDGLRGGIWTNWQPNCVFADIEAVTMGFAFYGWTNQYSTDFINCNFEVRTTPPSPPSVSGKAAGVVVALPIAGGLTSFGGGRTTLTGGSFHLISAGGTVLNSVFFNSSQDTIACVVHAAYGGEASIQLNSCSLSREVGGPFAAAAFLIGPGGKLVLIGSGAEHFNGEPCIINDRGCVVAIGFRSHVAPVDANKPYVMVQKTGINNTLESPYESVFIGCRRFISTGSACKQDKWTDHPEWCTVIASGHEMVRVIEHETVVKVVGGSVDIDAGQGNFFCVRPHDTGGYNLDSPINGRKGQRITLRLENRTGGAIATTWGLTFSMGAWVDPADNTQRTITFDFDGIAWNEVSRTPADIPLLSYIPSDFAGLVGWWKADALSLSDTDPVALWADSSAEANDLVQSSAPSKPLYRTAQINGKPAVLFDGVDDALEDASPSMPFQDTNLNRSIFMLLKPTADTLPQGASEGSLLLLGKGDGYSWYLLRHWLQAFACNSNDTVLGYGGSMTTDPNSVITGDWHLAEEFWDGTNKIATLWLDGVLIRTRTDLGGSISGAGMPIRMGAIDFSFPAHYEFEGLIAETVVYGTMLNDDQRLQIEQYFSRKYDLGIGG